MTLGMNSYFILFTKMNHHSDIITIEMNIIFTNLILFKKNLSRYDRPRVLGCEPVDGVLFVLNSNQINIATFVHQMGDVCLPSGEQKWQYLIDLN